MSRNELLSNAREARLACAPRKVRAYLTRAWLDVEADIAAELTHRRACAARARNAVLAIADKGLALQERASLETVPCQ